MSEPKIKLRTAASLGSFLDSVISESVKSGLHQKALQEKEKQQATSGGSQNGGDNSSNNDGDDTDLFGDDNSGDGEGDKNKDPAPSKTMDDEDDTTLKQGDVETKDVVDKLNSIRSGKSFKDDAVSAAMEQYVGSLSKAERTALFAYLKGIAQIVTGEISGNAATEPDSNPADVHMQKGPAASKTKHIEPNVIKAAPPKQKPKGGQEDTSGPVPITPKKK